MDRWQQAIEAACEALEGCDVDRMSANPLDDLVRRRDAIAAIRTILVSATVAEEGGFGAVNHRTDPRTMEERWRAMGFAVEWDDNVRGYVAWSTTDSEPIIFVKRNGEAEAIGGTVLRTVNEVEAYVVAHQEVSRDKV